MTLAVIEAASLNLVITPNPDGEVESVIPVSWTFNEELVERLKQAEFAEPHIVFIVASVSRSESPNYVNFYYDVRRVYHMPLEAKTPKQYVQFGRAGENIVGAFIVDLADHDTKGVLARCTRSAGHMQMPPALEYAFEQYAASTLPDDVSLRVRRFEKSLEEVAKLEEQEDDEDDFDWGGPSYNSPEDIFTRTFEGRADRVRMAGEDVDIIAPVFKRVVVPKDFFAKEPPNWARELVSMFYHDAKGVDECDFRKRFLISLGLSVPVQIYGIFARFFTFLYAVFMAKRGMDLKLLFALRPHDFGASLRYLKSFWFTKANGRARTVLPWVSPPVILAYAVALLALRAVIEILGRLTGWLLNVIFGAGTVDYSPMVVVALGIISTLVVAGIVFLFWLTFSRKGRVLRRRAAKKIASLLPKKKQAPATTAAPVVEQIPSKLHLELLAAARRNAGITDAEEIKDDTVRLLFNRTKRAVCQPFSR